ncbi:MAG: methyl-accepting chemotaxis protein [Magnetococcus sp. YQC-3]
MFKNMKLSGQLTVVFLFFLLTVMGMGLIVIQMNNRLEERLTRLDREDIPLALAVSEASRHQLEQVLRINEAFLFGETDDRNKFEVANEGFTNAGRRLNNVLVEARYVAQKGMERTNIDSEKRQLEQVKIIISDFQKIHADFEHLAGNTIRNIYKYRFLTKAGIITGNGNQTQVEAEQEYLKNLSGNISSLDDESKRLESKLKQAFDATRELARNLAVEAHRGHYVTWVSFILGMAFLAVGGLFLLVTIHGVHRKRLRHQAETLEKLAAPFRKKADLLLTSTQQISGTFQQLASSDDSRQDSMRALGSALTVLDGLAVNTAQATSAAAVFARETGSKVKSADGLIGNLREVAGRATTLCEQMQRNLQGLGNVAMQVNLLATSASAEASRSDASRGFAIFTDEIKGLSQNIIQTTGVVVELLEVLFREMKGGRDDVRGAAEQFVWVSEGAGRLTEWAGEVGGTAQKQSELIADLQGELGMLRDMATSHYHLIQQSSIANHTLAEQAEAIAVLLQSILMFVEERYAERCGHLLPEELVQKKPLEEEQGVGSDSGGSGE